MSYPLPGTSFYNKVKAQLQEKTNWTDSDELALLFRNTFAPAFYKQLHRYVHKSYRKHLAIDTMKRIAGKPASVSFRMVKRALSLFYYYPSAWMAKQKLFTESRGQHLDSAAL
ncbi:MAG: hypothetical protein ABI688_10340 [Bacteroidota bacterium]